MFSIKNYNQRVLDELKINKALLYTGRQILQNLLFQLNQLRHMDPYVNIYFIEADLINRARSVKSNLKDLELEGQELRNRFIYCC